MNRKINKWNRTKIAYINWLANGELRKVFSKSIKINNFSIWWITRLIEKDNQLNNQWYLEIHSILNSKKIVNKKKNFSYFILTVKVFKKFILNVITVAFLKFLYLNKEKKNLSKVNCFHSYFLNIGSYKNMYLDRQYGLATTINKKKSSYLIQIENNLNFFINFFKNKEKLSKLSLDYDILNRYVSIKDIFVIYLKTFFFTKKLFFALKKKNYFIIKKKDCSSILQPMLIESFSGDIQERLINGIAISNFFKAKKYKNFISYSEFYLGSRAIYHYAKLDKNHPNVISIQQTSYSSNFLPNFHKKNDFCKADNSLFYSPKPDIFLTQGTKNEKHLKKIFPYKKIYPIGPFKQLANYKTKRFSIIKKIKKIKKKFLKKKTIAICTNINDYGSIISMLNKCDLSNFLIILCAHPYYKKETILEFKNKFKNKFLILESLSTGEIISVSDFVISGISSLGFEALFQKKNVLRVIDHNYPPLFDINDSIPVFTNSKKLNNYLKRGKFSLKSYPKKVKEKYFYKHDNYSHLRFWKIINKISLNK